MHRQALHNGWLQNHRLWAFWCYCLLKASHKPTTVRVGFQEVPLEAGQFVFGREKAARELKMTVKQIRTCLAGLKSGGNVAVKTASKYSVITVVNWSTYQEREVEEGHENGQQRASKGPAKGHIQEVKEPKKVRSKPFSPEAVRLSGVLADMILKNNPGNTKLNNGKRESTVARWAADIDKLISIDGKTAGEIERVIRWCQQDPFWRTNILSGAKLREKFDQLVVKEQGIGKAGPPITADGEPRKLRVAL